MHALLEHCKGGQEVTFAAGAEIIHEGDTTGRLYVLVHGKLDVTRDDTVVASVAEPGAIVGEMSALLNRPHTASVRAAEPTMVYVFDDAASFLFSQPNIGLLVAKVLAKRLYDATTSLADIKRQYAGLRGILRKYREA